MLNTKTEPEFGHELTEEEVFGLCNSLNAYQSPLKRNGYYRIAWNMLRAQGMIARLWEENQELRKKLESKELQASQ